MISTTGQRGVMALIGAAAGASLYQLSEIAQSGALDPRLALGLLCFAGVFFTALLALSGPLRLRRAVPAAAGVALGVTALLVLASLRFAEVADLGASPHAVLGSLVLALVPLPFVIAAQGPGWRDYPTLFTESWTVVVRYGAAWIFVGVVWAVIYLSDALLSLVGLTVIEDLIAIEVVPFVMTGAILGLALAVVSEFAGVISPYLILRLLRLLLPVVLAVMAVFIVALPLRGLSGLPDGLSAAVTLLSMVGAGALLVTTAIDQSDADAVQAPLMRLAARGLALLLAVPAVLGLWAVWIRVAQHGWTPERVFAAEVAVLALGYGASYALAVLRGAGWMARIRSANVAMALVLLAVAALGLTPLLNPEAVSARSQLARLDAGQTPVQDFDLYALDRMGLAGARVRALLETRAAEPGQEALATLLAANPVRATDMTATTLPPGDVLAQLRSALPVQPEGATAMRDLLLAGTSVEELAYWLQACGLTLPDGAPGCVMVVADFWPREPGEEALLVLHEAGGYLRYWGLSVGAGGETLRRTVMAIGGILPDLATGAALIAALQAAPPPLAPAPLNQIGLPNGTGLVILP